MSTIDESALEAYLAGRLDGPALEHFEARVAADASLAEAVTGQHAIDASLRRIFSPPADIGARALTGAHALHASRSRRGRLFSIAAAAALYAAGLGGVFFGVHTTGPELPTIGEACTSGTDRDWGATYREAVTPIGRDAFSCTSPGPWLAATSRSLGQGLTLIEDESVSFVRAITLPGLGAESCAVGKCGNDLVLLIAASKDHDPRPTLPPSSTLSVFERHLGHSVLYEITPAHEARMLSRVRLAE